MKPIYLLFLLPLGIWACQSPDTSSSSSQELLTLSQAMTGSFSSKTQAEADSSYFDISLHMYPIWEDRAGGPWLYVEQALSAAQDRPYRQRVYQLSRSEDGVFKSAVYTLPADSLFIGAWKTPAQFESLPVEELALREGCAVYLALQPDGTYSGKTKPNTCTSSLRGASYATSEVQVFADKIVSWDQGFDSTGVQVWGAEKGGYRFDKLE